MKFNLSIFLSVSTDTDINTYRIDETIDDPETIANIINTLYNRGDNNHRYVQVEEGDDEGSCCFILNQLQLHHNPDDICWNLYLEYTYNFNLEKFVPNKGNYSFRVAAFDVKKRDIERHVKMGKDIF